MFIVRRLLFPVRRLGVRKAEDEKTERTKFPRVDLWLLNLGDLCALLCGFLRCPMVGDCTEDPKDRDELSRVARSNDFISERIIAHCPGGHGGCCSAFPLDVTG
jgi:hypothetical protein